MSVAQMQLMRATLVYEVRWVSLEHALHDVQDSFSRKFERGTFSLDRLKHVGNELANYGPHFEEILKTLTEASWCAGKSMIAITR